MVKYLLNIKRKKTTISTIRNNTLSNIQWEQTWSKPLK